MASVVVRDLLEFAPDVSITAADRGPVATPDRRVAAAVVDVRDEEATARLLEGHDAVANCVTYYFNVPVMRAALAARVPYTDLGGLYHGSREAVRARRGLPPRGRAGAPRHGLDPRNHQRDGRSARPKLRHGRGDPRPGGVRRPAGLGTAPRALRPRHGHRRVLARADGLPRRTRPGRPARERRGGDRVPAARRKGPRVLHAPLRGRDVPALLPDAPRGELQGGLRAGVHPEDEVPGRSRIRVPREARPGCLAPGNAARARRPPGAPRGGRARRLRRLAGGGLRPAARPPRDRPRAR